MEMFAKRREVEPSGFDAVGDRSLGTEKRMRHGRNLLVPVDLIERLDAEAALREAQEAETEKAEEAAQAAALASLRAEKEASRKEPIKAAVAPARRKVRRVTVFRKESVAAAKARLEGNQRERAGTKDNPTPAMKMLTRAEENDGMRSLPDANRAAKQVAALADRFENLAEPIEYLSMMLALAARQPAKEFRIPPLLLLGPPGIGKTYFAQSLAEALGKDVPWRRFSAGQAQSGFQLAGVDSGWSNTSPGLVFDMLVSSSWATGILVIDEVDKLGRDQSHPVLPTILDLLADTTAASFEDQSLHLKFDASRLLVIATANEGDRIDSALQSRMQTYEVPMPGVEQRRRIVEAEWAGMARRPRLRIRLDPASVREAAERVDLDLRSLHRAVQTAFARALLQKASGAVSLELPEREEGPRAIGFA